MKFLRKLVLLLAIHSLVLPGASEGVKFYLVPNLDTIKARGIGPVIFDAMTHAFFTLSVGIGALWMFSNSAYRMAAAHTSQGTGKEIAAFELSFEWFASALKVYADTIINYWIMPNHLLNIVICGLILILLHKM